MARTARVKLSGTGVADYHLMSRTNDRRFLFAKGEVKTELVEALKRAAEYCGVRLRAYVAMDNHFHAVVRVTRAETPVPEGELIRRVGVLKGEKAVRELAERWEGLRAAGFEATLEGERNRLRAQMNDISQFVKVFKELFDRRYKRGRAYTGSIWAGRFKSTLVEEGRYLATCVKYVVYNPIRAGIVSRAGDYRWSWRENEEKGEVNAGPVPEACRGVVLEAEGADRGGAGVRERGVRDEDGVFAGALLQGEGRGGARARRIAARGGCLGAGVEARGVMGAGVRYGYGKEWQGDTTALPTGRTSTLPR